MVKITLRGTDIKEFENGTTIYEVAKSISDSLARAALGGIVDGEVKELTFGLDKDCDLDIITFEHEEGKKINYKDGLCAILTLIIYKFLYDINKSPLLFFNSSNKHFFILF